jgi:hypothetical protein
MIPAVILFTFVAYSSSPSSNLILEDLLAKDSQLDELESLSLFQILESLDSGFLLQQQPKATITVTSKNLKYITSLAVQLPDEDLSCIRKTVIDLPELLSLTQEEELTLLRLSRLTQTTATNINFPLSFEIYKHLRLIRSLTLNSNYSPSHLVAILSHEPEKIRELYLTEDEPFENLQVIESSKLSAFTSQSGFPEIHLKLNFDDADFCVNFYPELKHFVNFVVDIVESVIIEIETKSTFVSGFPGKNSYSFTAFYLSAAEDESCFALYSAISSKASVISLINYSYSKIKHDLLAQSHNLQSLFLTDSQVDLSIIPSQKFNFLHLENSVSSLSSLAKPAVFRIEALFILRENSLNLDFIPNPVKNSVKAIHIKAKNVIDLRGLHKFNNLHFVEASALYVHEPDSFTNPKNIRISIKRGSS